MTCLRSAIKSAKSKTAEDVRTINDEHTSYSFDEKQQLKRNHAKSIFDKAFFPNQGWAGGER